MTRQLDVKQEEKESARRTQVIRALEFGLAGAIEHQGGEFRGLAIQYGMWSCRMTIKASFEGRWMVAFINSDSMTSCILAADRYASQGALRWLPDQYQPKQD